MLNVKANTLKALLLSAGDRDVRYYLNGVLVTRNKRGNALLVSTDGRRMLVVEHKCGGEEFAPEADYTVPREVIEQVIKVKTSHGLVTIDLPNLIAGNNIFPFVPVDGKFPDWRRVVPKTPIIPTQATTFDAAYLADFSKIATLLSDSGKQKNQPLTVCSQSAESAALVRFGNPSAFGVLMPIRHDKNAGYGTDIDRAMVDLEETEVTAA